MKKKSVQWQCMSQCGACCRLAPEERIEALQVLSSEETKQYLEMVQPDGWCKFYNKSTKICTIYNIRPAFCNVKNILKLFMKDSLHKDDFLVSSCKQQIRTIYGGRSKTFKRYSRLVRTKLSLI